MLDMFDDGAINDAWPPVAMICVLSPKACSCG